LKPIPRVARSGLPRRLAPAILAVLAACEASPEPGAVRPEPTLHGASLVVGTSADQWSLISVPRDGGLAETRDLSDLQQVVWTGVTELPPSEEAHALSDGWLVLRTAEGVVHTYDPASDVLLRVGEVSSEAVWLDGGSVGLYYSPDGSLLEVSREGVWSYGVAETVLWAAPVEDGVLVVLAGSGERRTVWLLRREDDSPAETGSQRPTAADSSCWPPLRSNRRERSGWVGGCSAWLRLHPRTRSTLPWTIPRAWKQ